MQPLTLATASFARAYVPFGLLCLGIIFCCGILPNILLARLASGTPQSRQANLSLALQILSFFNILFLTLLYGVQAVLNGQPHRANVILHWLIAPQLLTAVSVIVVSIKLMRLRRQKAQIEN